ncbi:MAG: hypothetical protein RR588_11155 [Solibacillus sp.]
MLKTPEAVSTMRMESPQHETTQTIPAEFVLPEQEEHFPIEQV